MEIVFQNASKKVSSVNLESEVVLELPVPAKVAAAVKAGKTVWYLSQSSINNSGSRINANKKIRMCSAGQKGYLGMPDRGLISSICAIEEAVVNPNNTVLSSNASIFGVNLVSEDRVYFSARRLELLDPAGEMDFYATANFFIPE